MTTDQRVIDQYNYPTFEGTDDFLAFRAALQVGSPAPDGPVFSLDDDEKVTLSKFWQGRDLLVEFGSLT
jgi:hypothetical protein